MKKNLVLVAATVLLAIPTFLFSSEASAKECEVGSPCPCGFYYKKGGWSTGGFHKSQGSCVPLGNMGRIR
ncbi:hypothetical protein ACFJXV_13315 [Enterococcus faecalis]